MSEIIPQPLKEWQNGKKFIASDNKALLVVVPQEGFVPYPPDSIKGKILYFTGVESKMNVAGDLTVALRFADDIYTYSYNTGRDFDVAMESFRSDQIPMMIDEDLVSQARDLLTGKTFWTKTNLWYDENGNRINGRKYVAVKVLDVTPGDMIFPLRLKITDENNDISYLMMNLGSANNESRAFHNLFSLTDIRKHYPSIEPETWNLISRGEVKEGMTKDEVRLSLGNPSDLNSGHDYSQTLDIWLYENGRVLWFEDGRVVKIRQ